MPTRCPVPEPRRLKASAPVLVLQICSAAHDCPTTFNDQSVNALRNRDACAAKAATILFTSEHNNRLTALPSVRFEPASGCLWKTISLLWTATESWAHDM